MTYTDPTNGIEYYEVTPEVREWYYDLFDFIFRKFDFSLLFLIKTGRSFGKYTISDEDLKSILGEYLSRYLSLHPETSIEEIRRRLGCSL